jgi:type VI secretion system protein ImpA
MAQFPPLESFLDDISATAPTGDFLFYEDVYAAIKEARRMDEDLPQGLWVHDLKVSDWGKVAALCTQALQKKSKDLQICAWLIESWIFLYGLEGAQYGFDLLDQLSQKYWDKIYPSIEENGDQSFRVSPYIWINEKLSERLKFITVSNPIDAQLHPINFAQYMEAKRYWGLAKNPSVTVPKDKEVLLNLFEKNIEKTNRTFFTSLKVQCQSLFDRSEGLEKFLNEKCTKEEAPTFHRFRSILEEIMAFADQILVLKPDLDLPVTPMPLDGGNPSSSIVPMGGLKDIGPKPIDLSSIKNRDEAYQIIRYAADYLEKLDPHSPVPHMLKRAVSWGPMPLKDLLQEIIKEPQVLSEVQHLLGLGGSTSQS